MIVDHSIARHESQRRLCVSAAQSAQALIAERDELLAEVNQWRSANAVPLPPREAMPVGQQLHELMTVESETFGRFPNGFGDNAPENESGEDQCQDDTDGFYTEELSANAPAVVEEALPVPDEALRSMDYLPSSIIDDVSAVFDLSLPDGCFLGSNENSELNDLLEQNHVMNEQLALFPQSSIYDAYGNTTTTSSVPPQSSLGSHQYLLGTASTHQRA